LPSGVSPWPIPPSRIAPGSELASEVSKVEPLRSIQRLAAGILGGIPDAAAARKLASARGMGGLPFRNLIKGNRYRPRLSQPARRRSVSRFARGKHICCGQKKRAPGAGEGPFGRMATSASVRRIPGCRASLVAQRTHPRRNARLPFRISLLRFPRCTAPPECKKPGCWTAPGLQSVSLRLNSCWCGSSGFGPVAQPPAGNIIPRMGLF
jgi:hypothetical protein